MAKVQIIQSLFQQIQAKFKGEAHEIIDLLESLESSPHKGKLLGEVGGIAIKEIRHESFRFYFITDGYKLRIMDQSRLTNLLIRFVRMSNKKDQQKVIDEIKNILRNIGEDGF